MGTYRRQMVGRPSTGQLMTGRAGGRLGRADYTDPQGLPHDTVRAYAVQGQTGLAKVCIVSHTSQDGGAERVLLETIEALRESGIQCLVVFPLSGPMVKEAEARGAECKILRFWWWVSLHPAAGRYLKVPLNIWAGVRLALLLRRNPCDLIITNTITVPIGALAAALVNTPRVWWLHEFGKEDHGFDFDLGITVSTWLMEKMSALVLVNSTAVASKYIRYLGSKKVRLLYYGVHIGFAAEDVAGTLPTPGPGAGTPRICIVGRIEAGKNQEDAIRALGRLKTEGVNATLLLVGRGGGGYSDKLRELSISQGVADRVEFTGHLANPFPAMMSSDILAICSRSEAFGRVTIEAMKLGKPVVGARSGGTAELIEDGVTGLLYTPGDDADLAARLRCLIESASLRRNMGERARSWAWERFTRQRFRDDLMRTLLPFLPAEPGAPVRDALRTADR